MICTHDHTQGFHLFNQEDKDHKYPTTHMSWCITCGSYRRYKYVGDYKAVIKSIPETEWITPKGNHMKQFMKIK